MRKIVIVNDDPSKMQGFYMQHPIQSHRKSAVSLQLKRSGLRLVRRQLTFCYWVGAHSTNLLQQ